MKYTIVSKDADNRYPKFETTNSKLEALTKGWEQKMSGRLVKVYEVCEVIYE